MTESEFPQDRFMIDFAAQVTTSDADRTMAIDALRRLLGPTRVLPGCAGCELMVDSEDPNRITLLERWEDEQSLVRHIASREFRAVLAVVDLSVAPPSVRFDWVARSQGLEFIRETFTDVSTGENPK